MYAARTTICRVGRFRYFENQKRRHEQDQRHVNVQRGVATTALALLRTTPNPGETPGERP